MLPTIVDLSATNIAAFILCLAIIWAGYFKNLTDKKASIVATVLGFYFIFFFPLYWFASLLLLYFATSFATKHKTSKKSVSHKKGRHISNILSNLGASFVFSAFYLFDSQPAFYLAFLCSAACACSDTLASEIGQLSKSMPRLITTWKPVQKGIDGAISVLGIAAAIVGAVLTVVPAIFMQPSVLGAKFLIIAAFIGFVGCNIDSLIGATFQLKGKVSNETTNLIATVISGILGLLVWFLIA
jgi:uncharacterized protein (TIGR00297 family)